MAKKQVISKTPVVKNPLEQIEERMAKLARLQAAVDDYDATLAEAKELMSAVIAATGDTDAFKDFGVTFTSRTTVDYDKSEAAQWANKHPEYLALDKTKFEADARNGVLAFGNYEVSKSASLSYTPKKNKLTLAK